MYYLNKMLEYNKENGIIINKYIRKTIQKQIRIHNKYIYRYDRVTQAVEWIQDNFYLTTGNLMKIELLPTQKWWYELMLGYDMVDEKGVQVNLINEIFLNLGRGSGKSSLMATRVLNWMILGGQYGGESLVIAYDNTQARHVFDQVRNQTEASDTLRVYNENKIFKSTKQGLEFTSFKTTFKKQTNDTLRAQGGNSSLNIFDEVHTYGEDITESVNKGSRQKQDNWQSIYITSGGLKRDGLYDKLVERFKSEEEFYNDRSFGLLYMLENHEQVKDKKNWTMALPLIGHVPKWSGVIEEYELAQGDPALQNKFLAFNMGLPMQDTAYYFTPQDTKLTEFNLSVFNKNRTYVGIDLSLIGDLTAVSFVCELEGKTYSHTLTFSVRSQYEQLDTEQQELWTEFVDRGELILLDTEYINVNDLIPYINDFRTKTGCRLRKIGYDPARYEILKGLIERYFFDKDGDNQRAIRQGFSMNDYIKLLKSKLVENKLIHNQKVMQWALNNTAVKIGQSGDYMYTKKLEKDKIDPTVALTMALEMAVSDEV
jgi:phage terminase large subunit-like protein